MKLSIVAFATLFSTTGAFSPVPKAANNRGTLLSAVSGREIRDSHPSYAAHGTGEIGSSSRAPPKAYGNKEAIIGEDIHHARPSYAVHGTGEIGGVNRAPPKAYGKKDVIIGEDIHHARPTYAAHGTGEIGGTERVPFVPRPTANSDMPY